MKNIKKIALVFTLMLLPSFVFAAPKTVKVSVKGMVCGFCAQGIKKKFSAEPAIEQIKVSLENKIVDLTLKEGQDIPDEKIEGILKDSGFNVEKIDRN